MKKLVQIFLFKTGYFLYLLISPCVLSMLNHRLNQIFSMWKVHEFKSSPINTFMQYPLFLHAGKYISIGENCGFDQPLRLEAYDFFLEDSFFPLIRIGENVSMQKDCYIGVVDKVIIGISIR